MRENLLAQVSSARASVDAKLKDLTGSPAAVALHSQLDELRLLAQSIAHADIAALGVFESQVLALAAAAESAAESADAGTPGAAAVALKSANAKARNTVQNFVSDYYDQHKFDDYLEFASQADERAYRKREEEREREIRTAMAENTAEGTLRAGQLSAEQLNDAGNHGADKSPDFERYTRELNTNNQALAAALGQTAAEKSQATPAPSAHSNTDAAPFPVDPSITAALKAAGVTVADQSQSGHGVQVDASVAAILGRV